MLSRVRSIVAAQIFCRSEEKHDYGKIFEICGEDGEEGHAQKEAWKVEERKRSHRQEPKAGHCNWVVGGPKEGCEGSQKRRRKKGGEGGKENQERREKNSQKDNKEVCPEEILTTRG